MDFIFVYLVAFVYCHTVMSSQYCYNCYEATQADCRNPSPSVATSLCAGFCYTLLNQAGLIKRGCSNECSSNSQVRCCSTSYCNNGGFNTCFDCDEAESKNCGNPFNPTGLSKINCSTHFKCFTEERSTGIERGCAETCSTRARTDCCTGIDCNIKAPTPLKCYSCHERDNRDCGEKFNSSSIPTVSCPVPNSCYFNVKNRWIERGCGTYSSHCVASDTDDCCSSDLCNDHKHDGNHSFSCYYCDSREDSNCGVQFNPAALPTIECDVGEKCYVEARGIGIERGCSTNCVGRRDLQCCDYQKCNGGGVAQMQCYSCTENNDPNCRDRIDDKTPTVTCNSTCFIHVSDLKVQRGCCSNCFANRPSRTTSSSYCSRDKCNNKTYKAMKTFPCYECDSKETSNCSVPFNPAGIKKVNCNEGGSCFVDKQGASVKRGCYLKCTSTFADLRCCETELCNTDSSDAGNYNILSIMLVIMSCTISSAYVK